MMLHAIAVVFIEVVGLGHQHRDTAYTHNVLMEFLRSNCSSTNPVANMCPWLCRSQFAAARSNNQVLVVLNGRDHPIQSQLLILTVESVLGWQTVLATERLKKGVTQVSGEDMLAMYMEKATL